MFYSGLIFIIVLLISALFGQSSLWGINIWGFYGIPAAMIFAAGSGLLLTQKNFTYFDNFIDKIKTGKLTLIITLLISLVLFIIFSESLLFLGDGYLRIKNTEALVYYSSGSPLGNFITIGLFDKIAKPNGISALTVWRIISYLSGIVSMMIFYNYGRKLFPEQKNFILAGLLVFLGGLSQMYFGYVESYPFYYTFLLGYFLSCMMMIKSREYSLIPAVWLVAAFFISPTAVIFSPAIMFSYYILTFSNKSSSKNFYKFLQPVLLVCGILIAVFGILFLTGFTLSDYSEGLSKVDHILNIFPSKTDQGIIDITHWNDILNLILLVVPATVLLPVLFIKSKLSKKNPVILFLFINFAAALVFALIFRSDISFVRDWDLFSILAYPIIFIIITLIFEENKINYYAVYVAIIITLFQTASWIFLNSNEKLSLKRMESISKITYLPDYAKSNNYDILRQFYIKGIKINNPSDFVVTPENKPQIEKSLYYSRLAYTYEKNPRYLYSLGLYSFILKQNDDAKKYLTQMVNSKYENKHLGYALLSKIYINEKDFKSAINQLKKVEEIFPQSETVKLDLANMYYISGEPRNAYSYFQRCYDINPKNDTTLDYLIELSYLSDTRQKTIEYYHQYNSLKPGNPATYYNIAMCFSELNIKDSTEYYSALALKGGISPEMIKKIKK